MVRNRQIRWYISEALKAAKGCFGLVESISALRKVPVIDDQHSCDSLSLSTLEYYIFTGIFVRRMTT